VIALLTIAAALLANDAPAWPPSPSMTAEDLADPSNWPSDPGYGYGDGSDGQWELYSFLPTQTGSRTLRPEETASGMSVDLAWRWTIGHDSVVIAVTDSGIEWDHADLRDRVWLNLGELGSHKPLHGDSSPCGGTGALEGFDCNGDGIVTVSDYADTPSLRPQASAEQVLGDMNGNGILDGGDLILNFSDDIDDDGNGYVDDIAGWDFMKDDNNPYDDTRYGHGTGEARYAVAEGDNGIGDIGACPRCRFLPMKVGDSYIADINAFGQAVVYATDNDARVVLCALGAVSMNRFAQQALDYAYAHDVLVAASMADENSRHHNSPTVANHVLPVHAITYAPGDDVTNVETFLAYNACSNYGGQNLLSASGKPCSSEAVGWTGGIAGLLYSAGIQYELTPSLTAGEALMTLLATADDIDVPESREEDAPYRWSQPGFDQRFGYGRVNANRAVEWIKDGRIPPRVDIVAPRWFEVFYPDRINSAVPIEATVSAPRAASYDYVVEWAPGVQPLAAEFQVIDEQTNQGPDTVSGADGPLAELDVRTISTDHTADVDSLRGENEHTITIRIRATAHYGGELGDVEATLHRTAYVHRDPDLVEGFPFYLGDSGEGSAKLVDLDGDGRDEIIYPTTGGAVHALRWTPNGPEELSGFPARTVRLDGFAETPPVPDKPRYLSAPAYASEEVDPDLGRSGALGAPAVADLDGDGSKEIVVITYNGFLHVFGDDGQPRDGFPVRLPEVPSCPRDGTEPAGPCSSTEALIDRGGAFSSPTLADMDEDGDLDIVVSGGDGFAHVFDGDGVPVEGWPVELHYDGRLTGGLTPNRSRILATPSVGDFNGDGIPEVLLASTERVGPAGGSGATYLIDGRGMKAGDPPWLPNWPVTMTSFYIFPMIAEGIPNTAVIGPFDDTLMAVTHGNASLPLILPADPGPQDRLNQIPPNAIPGPRPDPQVPGQTIHGVAPSGRFGPLSEAYQPNTMFPALSQPALADVDQDGTPDVIAAGTSINVLIELQSSSAQSTIVAEHLSAVWSGETGMMLPASPFVVEDFSFFNSSAVADLNGDDYPEVIAGTAGYFVHASDGCGREPEGWPKFTGQWIISTPALGDVDGDGQLEVVVATRSGWLYAWHTEGATDGIVHWQSYQHDNLNTGNLTTPLEHGDPDRQAAVPLTEEICVPPQAVETRLEPSGGCGPCATAGGPVRERSAAPWLGALLGMAALATRRRRRSLPC
jgi:hypothetical protein